MIKSPEITVYILNHNYGKYLNQAIKSVLNQNFNSYEIIIIDNGSTDNSKEILKKYLEKKKVRIIFQKNVGLIKSSNLVIKAARGKYIMRLDSDDFLDKNTLSIFYNNIKKNKSSLIFSDYYVVNEKGDLLHEYKYNQKQNSIIHNENAFHGACCLIKKNDLIEVGMYDEAFQRHDGYNLWLKFIKNYKISHIRLPLWSYRRHGKNSTNKTSKTLIEKAKNLSKITSKVKKNVYCVIPFRGTKDNKYSLIFEKIKGKTVIDHIINASLSSKRIKKVIISSPDTDYLKKIKSKYKNVLIHVRKKEESIENIDFSNSIYNYLEKKKKPDILTILNVEYPFINSMFIDKAINKLIFHKYKKIISVEPDMSNNFFIASGNGMKLLNHDNSNLKLEKKIVLKQAGGITVIDFKYFNKRKKFKNNEIGYIILDKLNSFQIQNNVDIKIANFLKD